MSIKNFLLKFTTVPKSFIKDFFYITDKTFSDTTAVIDLEIICKWLEIKKFNLKTTLIRNFENHFDYTITIIDNLSLREQILLTSNCFKELCMISRSKNSKLVRKYFIEMEKLVKTYYSEIQEKMYERIGILERNQKPKINIIGGVIYIIEVQKKYKIGKSNNIKSRINTYNTGSSDNVNVVYIKKVNDIDSIENCIKSMAKRYQYRKGKEIYEVNLDILKEIINKCNEISCSLDTFDFLKKEHNDSSFFIGTENI